MTASSRLFALTATATLTLTAACDTQLDGPELDGDVAFRCNPVRNSCGAAQNTPATGALDISALDTLGHVYKDVAVDEVVLAGDIVLDEFWAEAGQLHGLKGVTEYHGSDFLDAEFKLTVGGQARSIFVSEVTPPPAGESHWLYRFDTEDAEPVCNATGAETRAVVHDDLDIDPATGEVVARPDTVYLACLGGAAGKVAYAPFGYGFRPFELGLAPFEAALRFIRADYCGDGTSWTSHGASITYSDKWGVGDGVQLGRTDAVWGESGALCLGDELRGGFTYEDIECPGGAKPPRCEDAAEDLYLAEGWIWSALP